MKTLHARLSSEGFILSGAADEIWLIAARLPPTHSPGVMRAYFPRVRNQIQEVLLETLLKLSNYLCVCLRTHSTR